MIPANIVSQIMESAQVEEVVGDYVNLKKRGANLLGLCPFHNEKTPSFTVSPAKNIYKCFGCGKAGNSVGFIMEHEQMSYPEALRHLALRYNIEIPEIDTQEARESRHLMDALYLINNQAQKFYTQSLMETEEGKNIALSYFKERGFIQATINKFQLGYAPNSFTAFTDYAEKYKFDFEHLNKLGLVRMKNDRKYDFFRNRVMFPIHNLSGKVIAFAGRVLGNNEKTAKYINSPESDIYIKNKILYGIYHAKRSIQQNNNCFLVEGYTDVISMHQAGIENVVASSGTSLTEGQVRVIKRFSPNITILYDGDAAGIKAALRGTDLILQADMNVKVLLLPDGHDPDSFIREKGKSGFEQFVAQNAQDFILFKSKILLRDVETDPVQKSAAINDIVQSISIIPDPIKRQLYIGQCSQLFKIDEQVLINAANKLQRGRIKKYNQQKQREQEAPPPLAYLEAEEYQAAPDEENWMPIEALPPQEDRPLSQLEQLKILEYDLAKSLILYGAHDMNDGTIGAFAIIDQMESEGFTFKNELPKQIFELYKNGLEKGQLPTDRALLQHSNVNIAQFAINTLAARISLSPNWHDKHQIYVPEEGQNYYKEIWQLINKFKLRHLDLVIAEIQESMQKAQKEKDEDKLMECLQRQAFFSQHRMEIAKLCPDR